MKNLNSRARTVTSSPIRPKHRFTALALAVASTLAFDALAQSAPATAAKDAAKDAAATEKIVVIGQRAAIKRALRAQEESDNIVSVISSDDIGGLPDKNAAEALARMAGVSVQRDQGEGRYVTIRGLGPDLNTVTINGALIPAPELGRRGVALDVLPAGIVRSIEVTKTLRPDQDANSIGGTIEVKTLTAFDLPGRLLSASLGGTYDELIKETSPNGSFIYADRFMGGTFGVALGASAEKREFGSDNVETGGAAWTAGRLSGFELRDYLPKRERNSFSMNLDYRPQAGDAYYLKGFYSDFSDDEVRDRLTVSNISGGTAAEGQTFTSRIERRVRDRKYTQKIASVKGGLEKTFGDWKFDLSAAGSRASEDTPEQLNDGRFRGIANFTGLSFTDPRTPTLSGPATIFDPASYNLNAITLQQRNSKDTENHVRADLARKLSFMDAPTEIKFGVKSSRREKTNDTNQWAYNSNNPTSPNFFGAGPLSMTNFVQGPVDFSLGRIGPGLSPSLIRARVAGLSRDAARLVGESAINDWQMNEDINSGYLQTSMNFDRVNLLLGFRNERTKFEARGSQVSGTTITPTNTSRSYSNWLPNAQIRIDLDKETSLRAAWTNSVVRAAFGQLAPGVSLASPTEASFGNPTLNPMKSSNLDFGIERMLGDDGAMSAYVFTKRIKDFTYTTNVAGTGQWANFTTATTFANGEGADLAGVEVSFTRALRFLPAPFDGLIVGINATYVDADSKLTRFDRPTNSFQSRSVALPGQSARIVNVSLGYEKGPISTRLAANSKSRYLLQTGADILNSSQDVYVDTQVQLDFSFRYQLTKQIQLIAEGINLNREKYYTYQGSTPFNAQFERYGRTYTLGIKANLF
jgi:TonB-dependent receptor